MKMIATVVLGMAACAAPAFAQDSAVIAQGEKVYAAQRCALCHSIAGKGNKKGPLDEGAAKLTVAEIREWIVNAPEMTAKTKATRKPAMKSYAQLPEDDIKALVAYVQSVKKS